MVTDFVRQNFDAIVFKSKFPHGFEIDDNALIDKTDHRETTAQPLLRRIYPTFAQARVA